MPAVTESLSLQARVQLGLAVRRLREDRGTSLAALSDATGLSPFSVNAIERGRRGPSLDALLAIAAALDTTVRELLTGVYPWDDVPPPDAPIATP